MSGVRVPAPPQHRAVLPPAPPFAVPRLVERFLARTKSLRAGDRVLVAVSGGPDSLALLLALGEVARRANLAVIAAHVHHGLRGAAADADAAFVRAAAREQGARALVLRAGPRLSAALARGNAGGLEKAARDARYALLTRAARRAGASAVFVAHTADDQAETVLLNLCRGAGARGAGGMRSVTRWGGVSIVRPLLRATRADVDAYLADRGARPRLDPTNADEDRARNWTRRRLLPLLAARFGPGVSRRLGRTAALLRDADRALNVAAREAAPGVLASTDSGTVLLLAEPLLARARAVRRYLVREAIRRASGTLEGIEKRHVDGVLHLAQAAGRGGAAHSGALCLPHGLRAVVRAGSVAIEPAAARDRTRGAAASPEWVELPPTGSVALPGGGEIAVRRRTAADWPGPEPAGALRAYFDSSALAPPVVARTARPGERLRPFGFAGSRKLSDLLGEARVPREGRARHLVVADAAGVLWLPGIRRADRAPVTASTREIVEVTVTWTSAAQTGR